MDWTYLADGPLLDVSRENVFASALQEDCRGSAPLQVDGEDAPSDAGVLTVVDADVNADVDMASSICSSASAMSCDEPEFTLLGGESSECTSLAIDEEPPSDSSVPCCLPISEVPIGEGIPCQGMLPPNLSARSFWRHATVPVQAQVLLVNAIDMAMRIPRELMSHVTRT